jgi:hypothetical protein
VRHRALVSVTRLETSMTRTGVLHLPVIVSGTLLGGCHLSRNPRDGKQPHRLTSRSRCLALASEHADPIWAASTPRLRTAEALRSTSFRTPYPGGRNLAGGGSLGGPNPIGQLAGETRSPGPGRLRAGKAGMDPATAPPGTPFLLKIMRTLWTAKRLQTKGNT